MVRAIRPAVPNRNPTFDPSSAGLQHCLRWQLNRKGRLLIPFSISDKEGRKEGNVLFKDTLNTFYLRLYGVGHMVKELSDSAD